MSSVLWMGTEKQVGPPNHTLTLVFHAVGMAAVLLHILINFEIVQKSKIINRFSSQPSHSLHTANDIWMTDTGKSFKRSIHTE